MVVVCGVQEVRVVVVVGCLKWVVLARVRELPMMTPFHVDSTIVAESHNLLGLWVHLEAALPVETKVGIDCCSHDCIVQLQRDGERLLLIEA